MTSSTPGADSVTWLFVPGDRSDRFERAAGAGADEVILDLEDAVGPDAKSTARAAVGRWPGDSGACWVRVNGAGTPWHEDDLAAVGEAAGLRGVVVPRAEDGDVLMAIRDRLPRGTGVVALVETAQGIDGAAALARGGAVDRLAFGSIDFALDVGAEETDEALLLARSALVIASRLGGLPPPIDGVTVATGDESAARDAAVRARSLGFGGKLCIHPRQVGPVAEGFRPTAAQVEWATRVVEVAGRDGEPGTTSLDGQMIDRPVVLRARAILGRAGVRP